MKNKKMEIMLFISVILISLFGVIIDISGRVSARNNGMERKYEV